MIAQLVKIAVVRFILKKVEDSMSLSKQDFVVADIIFLCKLEGADLDESYKSEYFKGRQDLAKMIYTLLTQQKTREELK